MAFEIELLNERFDVSEEDIWCVVNLYWEAAQHGPSFSAFGFERYVGDVRNTLKWDGDFDGIELEITFPRDGDRLIWLGATYVGGKTSLGRHEHLLGYIEVRRASINFEIPVDVRIVCGWRPLYLLFKGMADTLVSRFKQRPIDQAFEEVLDFKRLVERQTYRDILVNGRPQENIAQALLQTFLIRRSYRETPVRGGKSDILVFDGQGRFLYETKIWRGGQYFEQGLREIQEYIVGEDSDHQLMGAFYIVFDHTDSAAARAYRGSDLTEEIVASRNVHVIVVNINPPKPSKRGGKV